MANSISKILVQLTIVAVISAVTFGFPYISVNENTTIGSQDRAFVQGIAKSDKGAIGSLLDNDLIWTNQSGETWNKNRILQKLDGLIPGDNGKEHNYGNVVYLTGTTQGSSGKIRFVRVWIRESSGWKVLLQQETFVVGKMATTQATVPVGTSCENPCKSIPYQAPSAEAQAVVASWEAREDAVNHRDADGWAAHVADEFVFNVKEDGNPLTKADRVAIIKKQ